MLADFGMLRSKNDVKLLVIYILRAIARPVDDKRLGNCIMAVGSANYFDFTEAFDELLQFGQVKCENELYSLTPLGLETIGLLEKQLPLSVRKNASNSATIAIFELKKAEETKCEILPDGDGFKFHCIAHEGEQILFDIGVHVYTEFQAKLMREKFKEDPFAVFRSVIDGLAGGKAED